GAEEDDQEGEERLLHRRKMEHQLQQNNICGVWKGLKTISGFKEPKSQPVGDQGWANDLNLFFNKMAACSSAAASRAPGVKPPISTFLVGPEANFTVDLGLRALLGRLQFLRTPDWRSAARRTEGKRKRCARKQKRGKQWGGLLARLKANAGRPPNPVPVPVQCPLPGQQAGPTSTEAGGLP
ncbi:hypothetical protein L3Q82_019287, partial [Scortum barcoo]